MSLVLLVFNIFAVCGQSSTRTVSGEVVYAEDGTPVAGASIQIEGTKIGGFTDMNGRFAIDKVPATAKYAIFNFLGTKEKRVPISNEMKVSLESDSEVLESVVVTGMQKMDKRLFTGATDKISADDAKLDGLADISRGLEGKSAGVSVQNVSGTFGTAPKIRIRGATSIYGSSKPLWVVDGVIIDDVVDINADELSSGDANTLISSAIAGLNSDDIESFQILKDGSATSIYGARAMAGVIVVTTKKGQSGQSHINYTGEFTYRLKPSYSTFNIMNSQDQMGVYQEMQQKGWLNYASVSNAATSGVYGKMYELMSEVDEKTGLFKLMNTDEAIAKYLMQAEYRNTDWFDLLFKNSVSQNHSISISSGNNRSQNYASLSVMNDPGWTMQNKVQRFTGNLNSTYKIFDNLSLNIIANASFRNQKAPGTLGSTTDVVNGTVRREFDINPYSYALNTSRTLDPNEFYTRNYAPFNIMHELSSNYIDITVSDQRYQGLLTWKPMSKMEVSVLGAVKHTSTTQKHNIMDDSNQAQAYRAMGTTTIRDNNSYLYTDPDDPYAVPVTILPKGGIYEKTDNTLFGWDFRASLSYNDVFKDTHIVNFYGGLETNSYNRSSTWFRGWGLQYNEGETPFFAYQAFKKSSEQNSNYYNIGNTYNRTAAFFATGTYSYKGRYTLNGTFRYEGTNRLGKSRSARWLPTWNISGAWNVTDEPWMQKSLDKLSHLTLKASYSLTADPGPSYVTNSRVVINSTNPWRPTASDKESILYISSLENSDLTYEKKHELNLGIEAGFLENRINVTADWYKRNNFDLIGITPTEGVGGEVYKYGNIASMKSNGVEVSLSTVNVKAKDFSWTTNIIYSHLHNEVTKLKTLERVIDLVSGNGFAQEGYPVRSIFSIPFNGLNEDGIPTFINQEGELTTSNIDFQEMNPEKLKFLKYSGSADPTDVGSFGNIFQYKGLKLNVFITYSYGNVIRLDPVFSSSYTDMDAMPKEFKNRWTMPGDENKTDVPVIASVLQTRTNSLLGVGYNAYNYSTARIAKGDFIRMKEISLTYDLPQSFVKKLKLSSASVKLQGTNLFLIYADKNLNGQDPEFYNSGGVALPVPKQFTFTLRLGI